MAVTVKQSEKSSTVRLQGAIDIASAAELKQLLIAALASGREVRLDIEAATSLDVTAVQLLWAARCKASGSGVAFTLENAIAEPLLAALGEAGLQQFLLPAEAK